MSGHAEHLVAGLDLGSSQVVGVIGEVRGNVRVPRLRVLGVAGERSAGVRRGVVRDIEETTRAIGKAMREAQLMAGVEIGTVYCGVAGEHVAARSSHGVVSVTGSEIRTGDVARVNDVASNVSFGRDHELLHAIPQDYLVDQQEGITEPIGMSGSRLEAEVYLVTVLSSAIQNLRRCVEKAGYHVGEFVLEPVAASLAVLTPDERELGCAIVELGGGSTNVAVFHSGKIRHTASSIFAGGHVTNDLVHGLQVTQQDAERLKERFGAAFEPLVPETEVVQLPGTAGQGSRTAQRRVLAHIMHMRLQEVLELVLDEISRAGYRQRLPAGVILTGGGALAPGIVELARGVRPPGAGRHSRRRTDRVGGQRRDAAHGGARGAHALRGEGSDGQRGVRRGKALAGRREGARSGETVAPGLLLRTRGPDS